MKFISGELIDFRKIQKIIKKYNVKAIFHLGAQTQVLRALKNPENTYNINLISTIKILEIIRNTLKILACFRKCYGDTRKPLGTKEIFSISKSLNPSG